MTASARLQGLLDLGVDRIVSSKEAFALLDMSKSKAYLLQNQASTYYDDRMPKRIPMGKRSVGYSLAEIAEYVELKKASRGIK